MSCNLCVLSHTDKRSLTAFRCVLKQVFCQQGAACVHPAASKHIDFLFITSVCVRVCLDTFQCLHSVFVSLNEETSRGENFPSVLGSWLAVAWQQLILILVLISHVILLVWILLLVLHHSDSGYGCGYYSASSYDSAPGVSPTF